MRSILLAGLGVAAIFGGFSLLTSWRGAPEITVDPPAAIAAPLAGQDARKTLAAVEQTIEKLMERANSPAVDMIDREELASAYLGKFRLTGDWADLAEAAKQADAGFGLVPGDHGPFLVRATVAQASHRLAAAEADVARVEKFVAPDQQTRADAIALRGDIAIARGDFSAARSAYGRANAIEKWPALYWRLGNIALMQGQFDQADTYYRAADGLNRNPTPSFRADSLLRQGELAFAQGKWPEATKFFADANRTFPGWWRAEMRVAQMQVLNGDVSGGIAAFEAIANRVQTPEAMDILAGLYETKGNATKSRAWVAKSAALWEKRVELIPEAAWAHMVEHQLNFGTPERALELAKRNLDNRPYGPSMILYAEALIFSKRPDEALAMLDRAEKTGFVSADLFVTRSEALALKGDDAAAKAARKRAAEINPHANDPDPNLAWLHH